MVILATCIEWSIAGYGTVHPSLTPFKLRSSFLSLAKIYMEHYKEQLTTCVYSSTVEPSNITYLSNSTVRLIKITIALISATNGTVGAV